MLDAVIWCPWNVCRLSYRLVANQSTQDVFEKAISDAKIMGDRESSHRSGLRTEFNQF
jgi:hypothetical protein